MTQHKIVVKIGILENDINPHDFHVGIWLQGSHSDWKTWKNEKAFSSQGKVREF